MKPVPRRFVVTLSGEHYRQLQALAKREYRVEEQQASYMLAQLLNMLPEARDAADAQLQQPQGDDEASGPRCSGSADSVDQVRSGGGDAANAP